MKNKIGSIPLRVKIWIYFVVYTIIVFVLLWFFQIMFLENFYQNMKISDVLEEGRFLAEQYVNDNISSEEYEQILNASSMKNDMCIEIIDKYTRSMYSKKAFGDCILHSRDNNLNRLVSEIKSSESGEILYRGVNRYSNIESFIYGRILSKNGKHYGYLFLNTPIEPVSSTVSIIKRQLMIITFILIMIAFIISIYVSKKIASPIVGITKSAKKLANGKYDVEFEGKGYLEAKELADTLTYAGKQISKVDTLQRDLIANVSHDLRTPLTMLKAYAEMIRDLSGNNPQKREEHLGIIIEETDRLTMLVNDMLDLSKLESGKQTLCCTEFEITEKMHDIIDRFKGVSEKMGYNIHFTPDEQRIVYCDIVKIEQVIYNLINNAINYTGKDKQVYVTQINLPDGVRIEVRDTGDGIEEDKIKLIFDKYYRSENHKREVIGTGLGLSIVKAILKMHNYDYGVNSVIGKGSVFWFTIKNKH
ncbi:MAG: HAMP domain-containing histidine kinase [Oscillospiraceae bacterium]|nr:HAMP domain-containing histidine kinase [Oscillospiraceae bacterium]